MDRSPVLLGIAALCGVVLTASAIALVLALATGPLRGGDWSGVQWAAGCLAGAVLAAVLAVSVQPD